MPLYRVQFTELATEEAFAWEKLSDDAASAEAEARDYFADRLSSIPESGLLVNVTNMEDQPVEDPPPDEPPAEG